MTADPTLAPPAEARLRAALDAAATRAPVAPAWDAIRSRLEDDIAPGIGRAHRRRRGGVLLAAAVLALVALGAAVVVLTRPEPSTVVTDDSTTLPASTATGWFVPVDLPAGWVVEDVTATRYPASADRCEGGPVAPSIDGVTWVDPARRARVTIASQTCLPTDGGSDEDLPGVTDSEVDLGAGVVGEVTGFEGDDRSDSTVKWSDGDRSWTAIGTGITQDEVVEAARVAVADGPLEMGLAGYQEADRWTAPTAASIEVIVTVTAPSGTRMHYRLEEPGKGIGHGTIGPEPLVVGGQDLPVQEMWDGDDGGFWAMQLAGFWPGADMSVMLLYASGEAGPPAEGSAEQEAVDREVEELVGHLRPATTLEWRAFLDGVEHAPILAEAESVAHLTTLDVPAPEPPPDEPPTTTTPG